MSEKKVLAPALVSISGTWTEQPSAAFLNKLISELKKVADVELRLPSTIEEWTEAVKGVNIIAGGPKVDDSLLKASDKLELIQGFGIGYDHIDVPACTKRSVVVCNVGEVYSESVAQHAWALILDLTKNVTKADRHVRAGTWRLKNWMGTQLWGKTLGVIGLGGVGGRVALKGRLAFNMRLVAYDPYVLPERAQLFGAELTDLEDLLKEADVIAICAPLTTETRHLIGKKQLSMMKKSAFLVNVSRGDIVDTDALIECFRRGDIKGAGLDVTEPEPLPSNSPLLEMDNVVLTPHLASSTTEAVEKTYRDGVANIIRYLNGLRPHWIINPEAYKRVRRDT